jgi:hypothetical protein
VIQVQKKDDRIYTVIVQEGASRSQHTVTLEDAYYRKLTSGRITPEELIHRSFEFLLAREPKDSILSRFELSVIQRYFPEYEKKIRPG